MKKSILLILLVALNLTASVLEKKGTFVGHWGYNRSHYTTSDIHLQGSGYSYTLENVRAYDRQSPASSVYLSEPTIPQYDLQIGYFISDTDSISFGANHMKYVMPTPQNVKISKGTDHQGSVHNGSDSVELEGFLKYEHTDGLNYINIAYEHYMPLWVNGSEEHALFFVAGAGTGLLIPRSNVTLVGHSDRKDAFKIAGFGLDAHLALDFYFFENYFIRSEVKGGYINMPWVSTSPDSADRAKQHFGFSQYMLAFGLNF